MYITKFEYCSGRRGFTMVEAMVAVALIGFVFTMVYTFVSQGSKNVTSSVWHSERMKESQILFKLLHDDLKKASDKITVNYTTSTPGSEYTVDARKFKFVAGTDSFSDNCTNVVNPANNRVENLRVIKGDTASKTFAAYQINKVTKSAGAANSIAGYSVDVKLAVEKKQIRYTKELVNGSIGADDDETFLGPGKTSAGMTVMKDVEFVYVNAQPILSELDGTEVGSLVHFVIFVRNDDAPDRKAYFRQSIKTSIASQSVSAL